MKKISFVIPPRCDINKLRIPDAFNILDLGFSEYFQFLDKHKVALDVTELNFIINGAYNFKEGQDHKNSINLTYFSDERNYEDILLYLLGKKNNSAIDLRLRFISKFIPVGRELYCVIIGWPSRVLVGLTIAKYIKEKLGKKVILSGPINNIFFDEPINHGRLAKFNFVDFVLKKPGYNLIKVWEILEEGLKCNRNNIFDERRLKTIPDLYYMKNRRILFTEEKNNNIEMDALPPPDLPHLGNKKVHIIPYEISKGCPYKCFYCFFAEEKFLYKSPQKVVAEIADLKRKYKCNKFYFNTTAINLSKSFLLKLLDEFEKEKLEIKWLSYAYPRGLDRDMLKRMYKAGCRFVDIGIEQGSEKNINLIKRKPKIKEIAKVLKDCNDVGIWTFVAFIVGIPFLENEVDYIKEFLNEYKDDIDFFALNQFDIHYANIENCKKKWGDKIRISRNRFNARNYPFVIKGYRSFRERTESCDRKEKEIERFAEKIGVKFYKCKSLINDFENLLNSFYFYVLNNEKNRQDPTHFS